MVTQKDPLIQNIKSQSDLAILKIVSNIQAFEKTDFSQIKYLSPKSSLQILNWKCKLQLNKQIIIQLNKQ